jgi:outer membrane protein TolC
MMTRAVDTSSKLFRALRVGYLDVFLTPQEALDEQLEFADTQRRLRFATVKVYKALGGGWK